MLSWVEHENTFITSGPDPLLKSKRVSKAIMTAPKVKPDMRDSKRPDPIPIGRKGTLNDVQEVTDS